VTVPIELWAALLTIALESSVAYASFKLIRYREVKQKCRKS
jgi:hypothetical protein